MDFMKTLAIAASGLRAQAGRMRIIAENIANADSTPSAPGEDPYRRKVPVFENEFDRALGVQLVERARPSRRRCERQCQIPNVNPLIENTQRQSADRNERHARSAALLRSQYQRGHATGRMIQRTIDILKA